MALIEARIEHRHGTATEWTTENPVLAIGEIGVESDTGRWKLGDGTTAWGTLLYEDTTAKIFDATTFGRSLLTAGNASAGRLALAMDQVDNTSDVNKPVSTAQQTAIDAAVGVGRSAAMAIALGS
jgi:hypothetical protein